MEDTSSTFHVLVPSLDQLQILVCVDEHGEARFPKIITKEHVPSWSSHTYYAAKEISHELQCDVYLRRALWQRAICDDGVTEREEALVIVDCLSSEGDSKGKRKSLVAPRFGRWMSEREVLDASWAPIHQSLDIREMLSQYFGETTGQGTTPSKRQSWRFPGWYASILRLVDDLLTSAKLQRIESLRQIRNAFQSTVLICKVRDSTLDFEDVVYVKCTVGLLHEAAATEIVSRCLPFITPRFIARSSDLFLQWHADGVGGTPTDKMYLETLARMQLESLTYMCTLKEVIPLRGPSWLAEQVDSIFSRIYTEMHEEEAFVTFRKCSDDLKRCCTFLTRLNVPLTLVHRDLNVSNVFRGGEKGASANGVSFIDWASCCIAHPFYDFVRVTMTLGLYNLQDEEAKSGYLREWLQFGDSMEEIHLAVYAAHPLMMVHMLIEIYELWEQATEGIERDQLRETISSSFKPITSALDTYQNKHASID